MDDLFGEPSGDGPKEEKKAEPVAATESNDNLDDFIAGLDL